MQVPAPVDPSPLDVGLSQGRAGQPIQAVEDERPARAAMDAVVEAEPSMGIVKWACARGASTVTGRRDQ